MVRIKHGFRIRLYPNKTQRQQINAIKLSIWYLSSVWHKLCQRFFMVDWGKKIADLQKNT